MSYAQPGRPGLILASDQLADFPTVSTMHCDSGPRPRLGGHTSVPRGFTMRWHRRAGSRRWRRPSHEGLRRSLGRLSAVSMRHRLRGPAPLQEFTRAAGRTIDVEVEPPPVSASGSGKNKGLRSLERDFRPSKPVLFQSQIPHETNRSAVPQFAAAAHTLGHT